MRLAGRVSAQPGHDAPRRPRPRRNSRLPALTIGGDHTRLDRRRRRTTNRHFHGEVIAAHGRTTRRDHLSLQPHLPLSPQLSLPMSCLVRNRRRPSSRPRSYAAHRTEPFPCRFLSHDPSASVGTLPRSSHNSAAGGSAPGGAVVRWMQRISEVSADVRPQHWGDLAVF